MARITLFTLEFPPCVGGVSSYVYQTAVGLSERGARVTVLTRSYPGLGREEASTDRDLEASWKARVIRKDLRRHANLPSWLRFIKARLAENPDETWLIADNAGQRIASFAPFKKARIPYYVTVHGSEVFNTFDRRHARGFINRTLFPFFRARALRFYDRAAGVIFVSRYTRELFFRYFPRALRRSQVIHNGVDGKLLVDPQALKNKLSQTRNDLRLITVSRVDPRKNHENVIRAVAAMPAEVRKKVVYTIVGDGDHLPCLKNLVNALSLERHVRFAGQVTGEEKVRLLDGADVFIMASKAYQGTVEGLGISFLEAGARGLPLIGSHHGGIPEIISPGQNGLLVDPESPEDIRTAISAFLSDRNLARSMGEKSRRIVGERFLRERSALETYEFLR